MLRTDYAKFGVTTFILCFTVVVFITVDLRALSIKNSRSLYLPAHFGHPAPSRWLFGTCQKSPCSGQIIVTGVVDPSRGFGKVEENL